MEQLPTQWLQETKAILYRSPDTARRAKKMMGCYGWDCVAEHPVAGEPSWWRRLFGRSGPGKVRVVYRRPYAARPYALFQSPRRGS